jgi:hypothetical protein
MKIVFGICSLLGVVSTVNAFGMLCAQFLLLNLFSSGTLGPPDEATSIGWKTGVNFNV